MDINTSVRLTEAERQQLLELLEVREGELAEKLAELGRAALREYVDMLLGLSAVRSPEMREQRLLLLILEAYGGSVPSENKIGHLFNLPTSGARSLLRSVLSRYRIRLEPATKEAATRVLRDCAGENEGFRRAKVENTVIVEHLNEMLASLDGNLKRISREPKTSANYLVPEDSFQALAGVLQP